MVKALDPQLKYHGFHVINVGTYHNSHRWKLNLYKLEKNTSHINTNQFSEVLPIASKFCGSKIHESLQIRIFVIKIS